MMSSSSSRSSSSGRAPSSSSLSPLPPPSGHHHEPRLRVHRVTRLEDFAVVSAIRRRVFLDAYGLAPAEDTEPADFAPTTWHFLGRDTRSGRYVAVARAVVVAPGASPPAGVMQIGRIAVLPEARGRGHGSAILRHATRALFAWPRPERVQRLFLHAIPAKCAFYQRGGFVPTGHRETVRGLLLVEMEQWAGADEAETTETDPMTTKTVATAAMAIVSA